MQPDARFNDLLTGGGLSGGCIYTIQGGRIYTIQEGVYIYYTRGGFYILINIYLYKGVYILAAAKLCFMRMPQ